MKGFVIGASMLGAFVTFQAVGGLDYQRAPVRDRWAEVVADTKAKADCRADAKCWAQRYETTAGALCEQAVEARGKVEWTAGRRFSLAGWHEIQYGSITYTGDAARMQNRFGAWVPVKYACDYHPESRTVVNVRIATDRP